jgi:uncharacterized protein YkwD
MKTTILLTLLILATSCNTSQTGTGSPTGTATSTSSPASTDTGVTANTTTTATPTTITGTSKGSTTSTDPWTQEFMTLINDHRVSIGLQPLTHDDALAQISQGHSADMANGTVAFGHDGFSGRCSAAYNFLGGGNWCGENVAEGQPTPQDAYTAWMNSPGHRANIEQSRATHTGFGYAKNAGGTYYWTQIFVEK